MRGVPAAMSFAHCRRLRRRRHAATAGVVGASLLCAVVGGTIVYTNLIIFTVISTEIDDFDYVRTLSTSFRRHGMIACAHRFGIAGTYRISERSTFSPGSCCHSLLSRGAAEHHPRATVVYHCC